MKLKVIKKFKNGYSWGRFLSWKSDKIHAIAHARTHTHAKVLRCVLNCIRKWNFWLHFFPTQLPVFDQDMWLYYMCLKQHFFSSVFFRFSLMLLFLWFPWLVSIYKNSFLSRFALLTLDLSSEAVTWGVL